MVNAIKSFYKGYFDYKGRSSLSEFWFAQLFQFISGIIIGVCIALNFSKDLINNGVVNIVSAELFLEMLSKLSMVLLFILFAFGLPNIALTIRRLRDIGFSSSGSILVYIGYVILSLISINSVLVSIIVFGLYLFIHTRKTDAFIDKDGFMFRATK